MRSSKRDITLARLYKTQWFHHKTYTPPATSSRRAQDEEELIPIAALPVWKWNLV